MPNGRENASNCQGRLLSWHGYCQAHYGCIESGGWLMEMLKFGPTLREIAVIGQGTWNIEQGQRAAAIAALRVGIELGMNHIDTAEMYGMGVAEEMVGEAIEGRRDDVFLVSKVLPQNATRTGTLA